MEAGEVMMMYGKLSPPLALSADFQESIDAAYEYFQNAINNRAKRPVLFDKEVFIEAREQIEGRPVGFWHAVSLEENHQFRDVLPCINDFSIYVCGQNCMSAHRQVRIKCETETRNLCLLRASRLPWIVDIIQLASRDDPSVQVWRKSSGSRASDKLYLRYNQDGADYVLIFSAEKRFYRLISAFPVFYTREKADFDRDYQSYAWSYFKR